jgi:hypothetical protein
MPVGAARAPDVVTTRWPRPRQRGDQGSSVAPTQRGWRCEHEGGEGRSLGKKDGGAAHQGGPGADEVADGAARWRFSEGSGTVEAEGLPTLTWRSGWRRAPTRCSSK